ncbi:hypothetical protein V1264_002310 [Littorina saxatilis]
MKGDAGLLGLPQLQTPVSFRPALRQLHKQRRETAALRELWHSFAEEREPRRQRELKGKACPDPAKQNITTMLEEIVENDKSQVDPAVQETTVNTQEDRVVTRATQADGEASKETVRELQPALPAISASSTNISAVFPQQRPYRSAAVPSLRTKTSQGRNTASRFQQRSKVTSSRHFRLDDVRSPVPYHTAITRRPERACSPRFLALTQLCRSPLPHLMDEVMSRSLTAKPALGRDGPMRRDIREWQNEIVKVVPARPEFVQRLGPNGVMPSKVVSFRYPYKVINIDPACLFYRSYSKLTDKDYVINPEWSSEKHPLRAGIAYRAKTDLCLRHDVKRM